MAQPYVWARVPRLPALRSAGLIRGGLVATVVLTVAMAPGHWPSTWPALRFAAGVASAIVFVHTSGWCLARLAEANASALGGAIYAGPGMGIVLSGLFASAMLSWDWPSWAGWSIFAGLAALLVGAVWPVFRGGPSVRAAAPAPGAAAAPPARNGLELGCLTLAYGLAGFGYIITATFLPVIARQALPGSPWIDLFWPIFGFGVMAGALLATRLPTTGETRFLLAGSYLIQATGIGLSLALPNTAGFALGSLLLGLPFTALTFFAMQEVRRLRPRTAASFMGLLTAMFGVGQIVGPPLVALVLRHTADAGRGFTVSLGIATVALLVGAVAYLAMVRAFPRSVTPA